MKKNMLKMTVGFSLSAMLTALPLGFTGCSNGEIPEIKFTAKEPCYDMFDPYDFDGAAYFVNIDEDNTIKDSYAEFLAYYAENITQKNAGQCYFLHPGFEAKGWGPYLDRRSFSIFEKAQDAGKRFRVSEYISLYDENYIDYAGVHPDMGYGESAFTVRLSYYTGSESAAEKGNNYKLEFGNNPNVNHPDKNTEFQYYINIYVEKVCVGTCYYIEGVPVSYQWFKDYFQKNLVKI